MNNVHPHVLSSVQALLPKGAVIVSAAADGYDNSIFMVNTGSDVRPVKMPKVDVATYLLGKTIEVQAEEGDSWASVMEGVAEKYSLHMLAGVDYIVRDGSVSFEEGDVFTTGFDVPESSVSMTGSLLLTVRNKASMAKADTVLKADLGVVKAQMAVASVIYDCGVIIVGGGGHLPKGLIDTITFNIKEHALEYTPTYDDLVEAEVIEVVNDGVSDIAIVKTSKDMLWYIRYRLLAESKPVKKKK